MNHFNIITEKDILLRDDDDKYTTIVNENRNNNRMNSKANVIAYWAFMRERCLERERNLITWPNKQVLREADKGANRVNIHNGRAYGWTTVGDEKERWISFGYIHGRLNKSIKKFFRLLLENKSASA